MKNLNYFRNIPYILFVNLTIFMAFMILMWSAPAHAAPSNACATSIQDKIAWDYKGSKRWAPNNLARLCRGAENSAEPGRCFNRVMHGGVNWGEGAQWKWENAIDLCEGTTNANATISCFQGAISGGRTWQNAIRACGKQKMVEVPLTDEQIRQKKNGPGGKPLKIEPDRFQRKDGNRKDKTLPNISSVKGIREVPGASRNTASIPGVPDSGTPASGARGSDGRPSGRDAAQAIREAAAEMQSRERIRSVTPVVSSNRCVRDGGGRPAEFEIRGVNFGASAAGRKIVLSIGRRFAVVAEASILSWSDTRIVARIPYRHRNIRQGQHHFVNILDARNRRLSDRNGGLLVCPDRVSISGIITMNLCAAALDNVKVGLTVDDRARPDVSVTGVPGDSFAMQYNIELPARVNIDVVLTPKLVGVSCPGGAWSPINKRISVGYTRARATQNFDYHVGLLTLRIPMSAIARIMQTKFAGIEMRINNYDPSTRLGRSNDTRLRFPADLGGEERIYDIPPVARSPRTYYINDINLNNVVVRATATGLRLIMRFENAGTEFIGFCRATNVGEELECALGTPSVQANLTVDVFLTLERYLSRGAPVSISFGEVRVVANPDARADGICAAIDVCDLFTNYKRQIKRAIEANLSAALDTTVVRDQVANSLLSTLRGMSIGRVNSAGVEGSYFVIRYIPTE